LLRSVGDADNFRLYHTPGFGWRGPFKFRHVPTTYRGTRSSHFTIPKPITTNKIQRDAGLKGKTIHIRMAGMDAPEVCETGVAT
jgi:endonuclease YncB( thermonuclease family)